MNGWKTAQDWRTSLLLSGDYGTQEDPDWRELSQAAALAGPDDLADLVRTTMEIWLCTMPPGPARLYLLDLVGGALADLDWTALADHHRPEPDQEPPYPLARLAVWR